MHNTPDEIKHAKSKKHMHWNNLKPYIVAHPDITFVLGHFSTRYKPSEIRTFFDSQNLPNISLLLNDFTEMNYKYFLSALKKDTSLMNKFMKDIGIKTETETETYSSKSLVDICSDVALSTYHDIEHDCCEEHGCDTDNEDDDSDGAEESKGIESDAVEYTAVESSTVDSDAVESVVVQSNAAESSTVESDSVESVAVQSYDEEKSKCVDDSSENTMSSQLALYEHDVSVLPDAESSVAESATTLHSGHISPTLASCFVFGGIYDDENSEDFLSRH